MTDKPARSQAMGKKARSFASLLVPALALCMLALSIPDAARAQPGAVVLNGRSLTIEQVMSVAVSGAPVAVDPTALASVESAHRALLEAGNQDIPVYGLNRGVGLNKDKTIFKGPITDEHGQIRPEVRRLSEQFNLNDLRATSAGVGPEVIEQTVRATMLIRLNTMLAGRTGAQRAVVDMYVAFLNRRIHPAIPSKSSVGEADINALAHIGLAMVGEGEVFVGGKRMPAAQALKEASLQPLAPVAKDALSIFSSNAYSAAIACIAAYGAEHLLAAATRVFALSLEAMNGNVAPFLPQVLELRPFDSARMAAERIRGQLQGSYLWEVSDKRALQDPLSYRTAAHLLGAADETLQRLKAALAIQINASDDNPAVIAGAALPANAPGQVAAYYFRSAAIGGAVIPTANFEPFPWVLQLQTLGIALSHLSRASSQRTIRLATPEFTRLSRFLTPDDETIGYAAIQKVLVSLDAENRELSNPVSADFFPVAGDIEDTATEAAQVGIRVRRMLDNLYYILAIELMHAAQAIDLRRRDGALHLGSGTKVLYDGFRGVVPFLARDRMLTPDIQSSYAFLRKR